MLQIKFIKNTIPLMQDAIEEARMGGEIVNTQYREVNGDLYFRIPDEEIDLWLELLERLADDIDKAYAPIIKSIEDLRQGTWQKIGGEPSSERESHGRGSKFGAAGLAAGKSPASDS